MVGRTDRVYSNAFGKRSPITFNLSAPLQFRDSKDTHGIQLADAIAATAVYVLSHTDDEQAIKWLKPIVMQSGDNGSIIPDKEAIDLKILSVQRNAVILIELHNRAKRGVSLIDGIQIYIRTVTDRLLIDPIFAPYKL